MPWRRIPPTMPSLLDLILRSAAPPRLVRNAVRGRLNIPRVEQLEILTCLCGDAELGEEAQAALDSWDEQELAAICGEEDVPAGVAEFFFHSGVRRPAILAALLANHAIPESVLTPFAANAAADDIPALLSAARARGSRALLLSLAENPAGADSRLQIEQTLRELEIALPPLPEEFGDYETQHAEEIAAQQHLPFALTLGSPDEKDELAELLPLAAGAVPSSVIDAKLILPEQREKLSTLQKIARLTVGERVQLAMKGTREERMILIRDGVKVVAIAVLESPKISEPEMESFAGMRNVQEVVLRGIAVRRRFIKNYPVVRALASNPKAPTEVALPLVKTLLLTDLKNLSRNKSVSDLVRRVATRLAIARSQTRNQ